MAASGVGARDLPDCFVSQSGETLRTGVWALEPEFGAPYHDRPDVPRVERRFLAKAWSWLLGVRG